MTVKENANQSAEPEISFDGKAYTAGEPDVPVAFASVLDDTPSMSVSAAYAASSAVAESPPAVVPGAIAPTNYSTTAAAADSATATTTHPPPPKHHQQQQQYPTNNDNIPPGAPPGGQWVMAKYTGNNTWAIITGVGCCLFWFCAMITAPCALFGLMCPCDEKRAYMSPNGVMYDELGRAIGDSRRNKYTVLRKA